MFTSHSPRVRKVLALIRARGPMRWRQICDEVGVGSRWDASEMVDGGWLKRASRGLYDLGPTANREPEEGSDAWLVLVKMRDGALTLDQLVRETELAEHELALPFAELLEAGLIRPTCFELAPHARKENEQ